MHRFVKNIWSICALILFSTSVLAQDFEQRSANAPLGGKWSTSGTMTHFSSAGQVAAQSGLISSDSNWTGTVGFIMPSFSLDPNEPPVAVSLESEIFYEVGQSLILEGYDPENDPIEYVIVSQPGLGTLTPVDDKPNEFIFTPNPDVQPDTDLSDIIEFQVRETVGAMKTSNTAQIRFTFRAEDTGHSISNFAFNSATGDLELTWDDQRQNDAYEVEILYFDQSDPLNVIPVSLYNQANPISEYVVDGSSVAFGMTVSAEEHPLVTSQSKVFIVALVSSENGNSDLATFIIDNSTGGRISASDDGLFFAFGSAMTVQENKQVDLRLVAVELGDFDLSETDVEILQIASQGTLGAPTVDQVTANTKTWLLSFTATEEIGGLDSLQFRIYHPERQMYDTAWARVEIKDVNDPPKITRIADQSTVEETPFTVNLSYLDPDNEVDILVESNESSKVSTTYENGVITVTPGQDYSGLVSINVIITEQGTEEEYVAFDRFDVEVEAVNDPPVVSAIDDQTILEDNSLTLAASATDVDSKTQLFDYSVEISDPSKFTVTVNGGNISIVPLANVNGDFEVKVYADDRQGTATSKSVAESFTLSITPQNDAPVALKSFSSQKIVQGMPAYNLNLSAYFTDVENGSDLTFTASGNSQVALSFTGSVMLIDAADDFTGVEDVVITASDGELSVQQTIAFVAVQQNASISVANAPGTLTYEEDFGTQVVDLSSVFVDDNNAGAVFTFDLIGGNFLNVTIDENTGQLTITAPDDYNGSESLYLVGSTGGQSSFLSFDVEVTAVNDAPQLSTIGNVLIQEDLSVTGIFVELSDIDNDAADLSLTVESMNGELIPNENLTVTATTGGYLIDAAPLADAFGAAEIKVTGTDGSLTATTSFNITVQSVNDKPTVVAETIDPAIEDEAYSLDISRLFNDVENDPLTFTVPELPEWASYSNGMITGTPGNDDVETWILTIRASDGNGGSAIASYQLPVQNVNDAPVITDVGNKTIQEDFSVKGIILDFMDIDNDLNELSLSVTSSNTALIAESGINLVAASGIYVLDIQPEADQFGEADIKVLISDGELKDSTVFTVTVQSVNDAPILVSSAGNITVDQESPWSFTFPEANFTDVDDATLTYTFVEFPDWATLDGSTLSGTPGYDDIGTYTLIMQAEDAAGETVTDQVTVTVEFTIYDVTVTVEVDAACSNSKRTVTASGAFTYNWYDSQDNLIGQNQEFLSLDPGNYEIIGVDSEGRTAPERVQFSVETCVVLGVDGPEIELYPNPTFDWLYIRNVADGLSVDMFDALGRSHEVKMEKTGFGYKVDMSQLPSGIYLIKTSHDNKVRKVVKQ